MLSERQIEVLHTIGIVDGFRYFSGYNMRNSHNCPTIYAVSGKFYVVGPGYEVECKNFRKAIEEYRKAFKHLV